MLLGCVKLWASEQRSAGCLRKANFSAGESGTQMPPAVEQGRGTLFS